MSTTAGRSTVTFRPPKLLGMLRKVRLPECASKSLIGGEDRKLLVNTLLVSHMTERVNHMTATGRVYYKTK